MKTDLDVLLDSLYADSETIGIHSGQPPYRLSWKRNFPVGDVKRYFLSNEKRPTFALLYRFRRDYFLLEIVSMYSDKGFSTEELIKNGGILFSAGYNATIRGLSVLSEIETMEGAKAIGSFQYENQVKGFLKTLYISPEGRFDFLKKQLSERVDINLP